ncbi:MAG: sodium:proton antiporter [Thaumarchaeota archaeon]|nr:sodium:proton antiporter [Nitrososphaerota archaeon]
MAVATIELALTGFILVMLVAQIISLKAKVPYTLVLVFIGLGIAVISTLPLLGRNPVGDTIQQAILSIRSIYSSLVDGGLFVGLVVPPLIFEAMVHIKAPDLRAVIRPSIVLATVGVVIATAVGGLVLWQLTGLPLGISILFAAIIAPTDVVTVLEVFRRAKVPSKLAALMDTEAAFNDATAIVIFSIVLASMSLPSLQLVPAVASFGFSTLGGALIGIAVAFVARAIGATFDDKTAKVVLTIAAVYGSYVFATGLGASGLIAVSVVGLYFGNVIMNVNITPEAKEAVLNFWQIAAFVGNSVAFLLIGFETNLAMISQYSFFILVAYLSVTVARAASVYPILAIFNQVGEKIPIAWSNVAMIGGMRGALSIALAASLVTSTVVTGSELNVVTSMVLGVAFLSIVIQVPLLSQFLKKKFETQAKLDP